MIQIIHEALNWTENHCNETKKKYDMLKGYDSFMDLVDAYVAGAQYIQNELEKAKAKLREKSLVENVDENAEQGLVAIKNESAFEAYEEGIKMIDEILKL